MSNKLVLLGNGGVGKTCLATQFCHQTFTPEYDPTIEHMYRKQIIVDTEATLLDILDTAGQEGFTTMLDQYIIRGEGFALVYSIANRESFEEVEEFFHSISKIKEGSPYGVIIIANKCDLQGADFVNREEGKSLSKKLDIPFFETSARSGLNVEEAFCELVREVRRKTRPGYNRPVGVDDLKKKKKFNLRCTIL